MTPEATVVRKPLLLFPVDCVTGECPMIERLSLMAAMKWIFHSGMQNLHGSANHNPVLYQGHLKSGKKMMTFSQRNSGERVMLDII